MRRTTQLLAWIVFSLVLASTATADPLRLNLFGFVDGHTINRTIDVSNGFTGTTFDWGGRFFGSPGPYENGLFLFASLYPSANSAPIATLDISGRILGEFTGDTASSNIGGHLSGSGVGSHFRLFPSVDPSQVPSWFPTLSATYSGAVTGGSQNLLETTLTIAPHELPEPTTLAVLGAGLSALAFRRGRRSRVAA
jgi:hypothetical protein